MKVIVLGLIVILSGCASSYTELSGPLIRKNLSVPDSKVTIKNLGPCTDSMDRAIEFNSNDPMTILVHGCNGSAGRFRSLAQLYAFHGQQAICYSYDDRDSLIDSSTKLIHALQEYSSVTNNNEISIIGHSLGGLVARKAMEENSQNDWGNTDVNITLTTVSAPLAGIEAASACGSPTINWLSFGIVPVICWGITGDNWNEITSSSSFINDPKPLLPFVSKYLKVVTNEKNTCRRIDEQGLCIESDDIFSLSEQYQSTIDSYPIVTNVQVDAGHVEIVGYKNFAPYKLLDILQRENILLPTPSDKLLDLELLITKLY